MDRRTFLQVAVGGAAATLLPVTLGSRANAQAVDGPFRHGVASGDPLADRLVIWTRVTPTAEATPGSGLGPDTAVDWEVARDARFTERIASGTATARAASDHTVKVDVGELPAGTELWYRFHALGATSPAGRGRTAPASGQPVDHLRFGIVSCSNWQAGFFSAYRHLAARDDLDAVFHLGDYLYEYGPSGYGNAAALGRPHDPPHEIVTLEDYRRRFAQYRTDPDLAALHGRYAWVITLDDHEVTNDSWADGAQNHQPEEGSYATRKAASRQAWFEWLPVRQPDPEDPLRLHRSSAYGDLVDLFVLDGRSYRSAPIPGVQDSLFVTSPEVAAEDRSMLGSAQRTWFEAQLEASQATWKLVLNPVMFAPLVLADLPDVPAVGEAVATALAAAGLTLPLVLNGDQWDGYRAEQRALTQRYADTGGVVVLTGDIHSSWAAELPLDPGTYLPGVGGPSGGVEFVVPAVTSDSFRSTVEKLPVPGAGSLAPLLPTLVETAAPWFHYLDPDRHGFGVLEVTPASVQHQWFFVTNREDPAAGVVDGPAFSSAVGSNRLASSGGLAARPQRPSTVTAPTPAPPAAGVADVAGRELPATGGGGDLARVAAPLAAAGLAAAAVARRAGRSDAPAAQP